MRVSDLLFKLGAIIIAASTILIVINVGLRNFSINITHLRPVIIASSVYIGILGIPKVTADREHIKITYFYDRLPSKLQTLVDISDEGLQFFCFVVLLFSSYSTVVELGGRTGIGFIPGIYVFVPFFVASSLICVEILYRWTNTVMNRSDEVSLP